MEAVINKPFCADHSGEIEADLQNSLALVEKGINNAITNGEDALREMCAHITNAGGKRIRPQLVIHCGLAFSDMNALILDTAVAAELIHMASLVHDDVIDKANFRRGKPSVNSLWGNHAAILCGDWLFAEAFGLLSGKGMASMMRYMVDAIQAMCLGELLQARNRNNLDIGLETYYKLITCKTAKLLESCCMAGALAGHGCDSDINALGKYGRNIGIAFQIIDDILDFRGKTGRMGKPKGEDLRQGLITLPVILLLQDTILSSTARALLSDNVNVKTVHAIQDLLDESRAIEESFRIAGSFIDKAQSSLDIFSDSRMRVTLFDLADSLRHREN